MKKILSLLIVALFLAIILFLLVKTDLFEHVFPWNRVERSALEVLQSEELVFLVTDRITTQICVELFESNWLLGNREGILITKVRFYYGIDLTRLTEDSLERIESGIIIHVPDAEILELAADLESVRFYSKRSGLVALSDLVSGYDQNTELLVMLDSVARAYAYEEELLPSRNQLLQRLNNMSPILSEYLGVSSIEFR